MNTTEIFIYKNTVKIASALNGCFTPTLIRL